MAEVINTNDQDKPRKKRKFVGKRKIKTVNKTEKSVVTRDGNQTKVFRGRVSHTIPDEILNNAKLNETIEQLLPTNYNFEIHKTIHRLLQNECKLVALQFPEGLLMYGGRIADILREFANVDVIMLGDVTYGACCVDDFTARALGADFLVHYGHSCLVPIDVTQGIKCLYVFVDIKIDIRHFIETVKYNFDSSQRLALIGTIQFASSLQAAAAELKEKFQVSVPQSKPLSRGEVLGCTSPHFTDVDAIVYLADGRFHLESVMIHNPTIPAFKYDPYSKKFTKEEYLVEEMFTLRKQAIKEASEAKKVGVILGTLGRQGSPRVLKHIEELLSAQNVNYSVVLLSEVFPSKLDLFSDVDAWIQIACPRLSIDWGYAFTKPLLNPYEAEVAWQGTEWKEIYPMDFYAKDGGAWSVYHQRNK
uniref:2-(3-amino-3-carboxypropyl)histidine synthase subunit 1 n=1 Tax=Vannella robusta TaxID=1487602 RepID=A0A7S4IJV5_9EUKA|mmetsp:Transcript_3728/g.4625  ORF Transcript_3728/g.4625 Transcript_3728/m.4625 type:complete len:418 (+) Transcript_3728:16-1269(+)